MTSVVSEPTMQERVIHIAKSADAGDIFLCQNSIDGEMIEVYIKLLYGHTAMVGALFVDTLPGDVAAALQEGDGVVRVRLEVVNE